MTRILRPIFSFLSCLACVVALRAEIAAGADDDIVRSEPLVVRQRLLTGSPATVTRLGLDATPGLPQSTGAVAERTANFFVADNGARSFNDVFALRGLTNTPIFGDPAVTVYLDDLPLGSGFTYPTDLTGFARAELHRGPGQNTVFGRAGSVGVLRLATPANSGSVSGQVRASAGNHEMRTVSAQLSTATGGAADAYVSAGWAARDGYIVNTQLDRTIDDKDARSALTRFRYRPNETTELTLLVAGFRARDGVQPLVPLAGPLFRVSRSAEGVTEVDAWNASLKAAFDTPLGLFSATTSFSDWDLGPYSNTLDFGFAELSNAVAQRQRTWSEELKLASSPRTALRWQAGAFFSDAQTEGAFVRAFGPMTYENSRYRIETRSLAAFGETTVDVGPALSLTAGLRAEHSRKTLDRRELVPVGQTMRRDRESTALLPKLAARYALDAETTLFGSVAAGYKPGGFSAFTGNAALAPFGPERTRAFEAGITRAAAQRRLEATARVFWYSITGYQIERSFATNAIADDYLVVNAPRARSLGGELELAWRPIDGLTLAADFGATDVTLREFRDPYTGARYDGRRAPSVPTHDASLRIDYRHSSGWFGGAELDVVGRTYFTEGEELAFGQRSYELLNARLGYATKQLSVTLFGANLTDETYYSAITPGTGHATPGAPRTYGVEVGVKW